MFSNSIGASSSQSSASVTAQLNRLKDTKTDPNQGATLSSTVEPIRSELMQKISQESLERLLQHQLTEQFSNANITVTIGPKVGAKADDVAISYITQNYQQGLNEGKAGKELTQILNQSAENYRAAYGQTSAILEKLGQLGPEQQSFISRSESRVERALYSFDELLIRDDNAEGDGRSFELKVATQEGDTVTIRFSSSQALEEGGMNYQSSESHHNTFDSFELSYEVEGELSDQEHQAIQTIFANVGELADDYFGVLPESALLSPIFTTKSDFSTNLLEGFNSEQLAGVDLSMVLSNSDEFDYSYEFNPISKKQKLSVEHDSIYSPFQFDITTSTIGGKDADQLAQYLEVLESNLAEVSPGLYPHTRNELALSLDTYKSALSSLFELSDKHTQLQEQAAEHFANGRQLVADLTNELIRNDERYQKLPGSEQRLLNEGISNLADFKAEFTFANEDKHGYFNVTQQQKTEFMQAGDYKGVKQTKDYESHTLTGHTDKGSKETTKSEHYEAKAAVEKGKVVALDQETHAEQHDAINIQVEPGIYISKLVDETSDSSSSLRLVEDIWTQNVSAENETKTDYSILYGKKVVHNSVKVERDAYQKQTLIGELDKLTNKDFMREKYAPHLARVNQFMAEV